VEPASGQSMWRLLGANGPKLRDFESNRDKGRSRGRQQPYVAHLGLSMFDSLDLAVRNARIFPAHVARVQLAAGHGFSIARTFADTKGHHTVWGEPAELWGHVVAVDTATTVY
jgi:hypothetical protein